MWIIKQEYSIYFPHSLLILIFKTLSADNVMSILWQTYRTLFASIFVSFVGMKCFGVKNLNYLNSLSARVNDVLLTLYHWIHTVCTVSIGWPFRCCRVLFVISLNQISIFIFDVIENHIYFSRNLNFAECLHHAGFCFLISKLDEVVLSCNNIRYVFFFTHYCCCFTDPQ